MGLSPKTAEEMLLAIEYLLKLHRNSRCKNKVWAKLLALFKKYNFKVYKYYINHTRRRNLSLELKKQWSYRKQQ